jgi:hypothetical protein
MRANFTDWGAHACSVLMPVRLGLSAFCRNDLPEKCKSSGGPHSQEKFAIAKCDRQHATSVRSQEN